MVNKKLKSAYANKPFLTLLEKGLFRQALAMALFDNDISQQETFLQTYGRLIGKDDLVIEEVKKIFGVYDVLNSVNAVELV